MISFEKIIFEKKLPNSSISTLKTFRYIRSPLIGIGSGGTPFIYFDELIQKTDVAEAFAEVQQKKEILRANSKLLSVNGIVPKNINCGVKSIDSILAHYEKYLTTEQIQELSKCRYLSEVKKIANESLGQKSNWELFVHLREFSNFESKSSSTGWREFMKDFPFLKKLVESLPFQKIGYAVLFFSNPNVPVYIHRDVYPRENNSHFVNINLDLRPREFFVFDGFENKKTIRQSDKFSYMFNESDLHGASADSNIRITLRVEGEFNSIVANEFLGKEKVFSFQFPRTRDFLLPRFEIIEETDI